MNTSCLPSEVVELVGLVVALTLPWIMLYLVRKVIS